MTKFEPVTLNEFPELEALVAIESRQSPVPEAWEPYRRAMGVVASAHNYAEGWDEVRNGRIVPQERRITGMGPRRGRRVRKAIMRLAEADIQGTLQPPLSEDLRGIFTQMKFVVDARVPAQIDSDERFDADRHREDTLELVDLDWFAAEGVHRDAAMLALKLAVEHGIAGFQNQEGADS